MGTQYREAARPLWTRSRSLRPLFPGAGLVPSTTPSSIIRQDGYHAFRTKIQDGSAELVVTLSSRDGGSTQKIFCAEAPRNKKSKAIIVKVTPLQSQGTRSVRVARHLPDHSEPQSQRLSRVLKDRPCCDRDLMLVSRALEQTPPYRPSFVVSAVRASEPLGPAEPEQVLPARFLDCESLLRLNQLTGIVFHASTPYVGEPDLRGYPEFN